MSDINKNSDDWWEKVSDLLKIIIDKIFSFTAFKISGFAILVGVLGGDLFISGSYKEGAGAIDVIRRGPDGFSAALLALAFFGMIAINVVQNIFLKKLANISKNIETRK